MDVSIIIPTYNRLWSLPQAIESCRGSRYSTEIIVVDDGSSDGTRDWLDTQKDITVLSQENWGKCWAVNAAFAIARGKYVRFLDSDDMLDKDAIDEQFELAETSNADLVVSGYKVIDEHGSVIRAQNWIFCDDFIAQQLGENDSSHYSSYLFLKSFISDIPHRPDFAFRDDRLLVLEAALKYPKLTVHKGTALLHRIHKAERLQFNSNLQQSVQNYQHFKLYQKILRILESRGELTQRRSKAAIKILWPLSHWISKNSLKDAFEVYAYILSLDPGFRPPEKGLTGFLYKKIGFKHTERMLTVRRLLKYGLS